MTVVFFDRDGVINENRPPNDYVKQWQEFVFVPTAKKALRKLAERDEIKIFVVTNQAGVRKGLVSAERVEEINSRMTEEIEAAGGRVDGVFYCPHGPQDGCSCRKPQAGLLFRALDAAPSIGGLARCFMVGDSLSDIEAAKKVSAVTLMVKTGRGKEQLKALEGAEEKPDFIVEDISEAVDFILNTVDR